MLSLVALSFSREQTYGSSVGSQVVGRDLVPDITIVRTRLCLGLSMIEVES